MAGNEIQIKRMHDLFFFFRTTTQLSVMFSQEWQGGGIKQATKRINKVFGAPTGIAIYGTALYGTDVYGSVLTLQKVKLPTYGNGEAVKLGITGTTSSGGGLTFMGATALLLFMNPSRSYI